MKTNYLDNISLFPNNILEPTTFEYVEDYTVYGFTFKGLQDLYEFLKKDPAINTDVFNARRLSSTENDYDFAGRPYNEAVELLIKDTDPGYQEYLKVQRQIKGRSTHVHKYKDVKNIAGGALDIVSYVTMQPEIYRTSRLIEKPKFITLDIQIAYHGGTSKDEVFNKAVIVTNLIHALERKGYNVNVNSFETSYEGREIVKSVFKIKRPGQRTNYQALYKTLVDVEFLRRICFRLNEVSAVQDEDWSYSYGHTMDEEMIRALLKLKKDDIYFGQPSDMGIEGYDIGEDFENAICKLNLDTIIDVKKEKEIIRDSVKVLRR